MTRIAEQHSPKEALSILEILNELGFDSRLLNSEAYVKRRPEALTKLEMLKVRRSS
jgi:hypothetical protein